MSQIPEILIVLRRWLPGLHPAVATGIACEIVDRLNPQPVVDIADDEGYSMTPSRTVDDRWYDN